MTDSTVRTVLSTECNVNLPPTDVSLNIFPWTKSLLDDVSLGQDHLIHLIHSLLGGGGRKDVVIGWVGTVEAGNPRSEHTMLVMDTPSKGRKIQGMHCPRKDIRGQLGRGRIVIASLGGRGLLKIFYKTTSDKQANLSQISLQGNFKEAETAQ